MPVALVLLAGSSACQDGTADLGGGPPSFACAEGCFVDRSVAERYGTPGDWFWGETTTVSEPEIVYPLESSIHPKNFEELTVQWRRLDRGQTLFRLRFVVPDLQKTHEAYVPCLATDGEGCRYQLPERFFAVLRGQSSGRTIELTVSGTDGAGGPVTTSKAVKFRFTPRELLEKGFYYWSSGPDFESGRSYRLAAGARRPDPFIDPSIPSSGNRCSGCHALSRDGLLYAFTALDLEQYKQQINVGRLVVVSTADPTRAVLAADSSSGAMSSMIALTRDGSRALVSVVGQLELREVIGGRLIASFPSFLGKRAFFPEFSPSDQRVVVTLSDDNETPVRTGSIAVLGYDPAATTPESILSDPVILVPSTPDEFHFYPTWSPDEKYVAFVSAPYDGLNRSSNQKFARLRLVRVEDGQPFELGLATQGDGTWSTLPKFAPFLQADQEGLLFLTFTSKIDYGLLLRNTSYTDELDRLPQLWMTAIDPARLPGDPSSAPVWLPFQSFIHRGLLGYWTDRVICRQEGLTDANGVPIAQCGPGETCVERTDGPSICLYKPR